VAAVAGDPLAYWTPERMRAADALAPRIASTGTTASPATGSPVYVPAASAGEAPEAALRRGPVGVASAYSPGNERLSPNRIHGRVFATSPSDGDYSCSGTAVNSPGRSLVVTAGHCVFLNGEWGVNFMFVPGYRDGRSPYGRWAGTKLRAPPQWVAAENISFDIGMVTVSRNLSGRAVQDVVGARGIGFNQPRRQIYTSYGYPAEPPFDGESLKACRSEYQGEDSSTDPPRTMRITCDMNGGASGGGWIAKNTLLSVNSYCTGLVLVCFDVPASLYGPYLASEAKSLYLQARGRARRCGGRLVTQLGGPGRQYLRGSANRDVISLRGGNDEAAGGGGRDTICGGPGPDELRGGRGRDVCIGGPGRDTAAGCEVLRRIP
jgi:V8-like Glu-specific endopeptidase